MEGFFWEDFFGRNFLGGFFWEEFFGRNSLFTLLKSALSYLNMEGIDLFVKILVFVEVVMIFKYGNDSALLHCLITAFYQRVMNREGNLDSFSKEPTLLRKSPQ